MIHYLLLYWIPLTGGVALPFFCPFLSLSLAHKRAQPGEYTDAHFNLESMNKQWGFHVRQKFPLATFTHTLHGWYTRACVKLTLTAGTHTHTGSAEHIMIQIFDLINNDGLWDVWAHAIARQLFLTEIQIGIHIRRPYTFHTDYRDASGRLNFGTDSVNTAPKCIF